MVVGACLQFFLLWYYSNPLASKEHVWVFFLVVICWFLWLERNNAHFRDSSCQASNIICQVNQFMELFGVSRVFKVKHFKGDRDCEIVSFCYHIYSEDSSCGNCLGEKSAGISQTQL